jgi:hypothetical protein
MGFEFPKPLLEALHNMLLLVPTYIWFIAQYANIPALLVLPGTNMPEPIVTTKRVKKMSIN